MQTRKLLIALVVLALLAVVAGTLDPAPPPTDSKPLPTPFHPTLTAEQIEWIRITDGGQTVTVKRTEVADEEAALLAGIGAGTATSTGRSVWLFGNENNRLADSDLAETAAETLAALSWNSQAQRPDDLSAFGLGDGGNLIEFRTTDGRQSQLELGSESPLGTKRYALLDPLAPPPKTSSSPQISLVDSWSLRVFDRDPLSFRESRVFPFDVARVAELRVGSEDRATLVLQKVGRSWHFTDANGLRAETEWVKESLRMLAGLQAASSIPSTEPLEPTLWIEVRDDQGRLARLNCSRNPSGRTYQVHSSGTLLPSQLSGTTSGVEAKAIDRMLAEPDSLRALELLDFNPGTATQVIWEAQGVVWTLQLDQEEWRKTSSAGIPDTTISRAEVTAFLETLDGFVAQSYSTDELTEDGVGPEVARLLIRQKDGLETGLRLFRDGLQDRVAIQGEPGLREVAADVGEFLSRHRNFDSEDRDSEETE